MSNPLMYRGPHLAAVFRRVRRKFLASFVAGFGFLPSLISVLFPSDSTCAARRGAAMIVRRSDRRMRPGATAVEFAAVAPVFFLLVLGIIEVGRACMVTELLTEAARRACRQGVIEGTSSSSIQQTAVNYLSNVGIDG